MNYLRPGAPEEMISKPWGVSKEESPFSIDFKGGKKEKEVVPNDKGSNDRMKKLEKSSTQNKGAFNAHK